MARMKNGILRHLWRLRLEMNRTIRRLPVELAECGRANETAPSGASFPPHFTIKAKDLRNGNFADDVGKLRGVLWRTQCFTKSKSIVVGF
jgi:hypothetical protein